MDLEERYNSETNRLVARRGPIGGSLLVAGTGTVGLHEYYYHPEQFEHFAVVIGAATAVLTTSLAVRKIRRLRTSAVPVTQILIIGFLIVCAYYYAQHAMEPARLAFVFIMLELTVPLLFPWGIGRQLPIAIAGVAVYDAYWSSIVTETHPLPLTSGLSAVIVAAAISTIGAGVLKQQRLTVFKQQADLDAARETVAHRERLATIGETTAMVVHQIARYLSAIGFHAHLIAEGQDREPDRASASEVQASTGHAGYILKTLEEARRVVDGLQSFGQDRQLEAYPESLARVADECVSACRAHVAQSHLALCTNVSGDATVLVDKHMISQAIANILDNAIDASFAGSHIDVTVSTEDGRGIVRVRDYGAGISDSVQGRLSTPFVTTKRDGMGLGLALARVLVEAHHGTLTWTSMSPGTEFCIAVPLADAEDKG